jgi:hypothetical protein
VYSLDSSAGPDYQDFQTIEGKIHGIIIRKKPTLIAEVKLLKAEIVYLLLTYLLTAWSRVLLEKLTSLCS